MRHLHALQKPLPCFCMPLHDDAPCLTMPPLAALQVKRKRKNVGSVKIVVAGCVAQQEGEAMLRRVPEVDIVMGQCNKPGGRRKGGRGIRGWGSVCKDRSQGVWQLSGVRGRGTSGTGALDVQGGGGCMSAALGESTCWMHSRVLHSCCYAPNPLPASIPAALYPQGLSSPTRLRHCWTALKRARCWQQSTSRWEIGAGVGGRDVPGRGHQG